MAGMQLPHCSHNPTGHDTILLVHGGFSSSEEWDGVWPLLAAEGYHLLVPDLPAHGTAVGIHPLQIDDAARRLAELIRDEAHGAVAHVVAISIGAHIVAALASHYPSRLRSLIVSGFNLFAPKVFSPLLPPLVYLVQRGSGFIQKPAAEWQRFCQGLGSLSTTRDIFNILFSSRELQPITVRTLVIAATREGIAADNVDHSRRLFHTVVADNGSQLVQHRQMRHPWNVDEPALFAKMVMCWIRGECLPAGFEDIIAAAVERTATAGI